MNVAERIQAKIAVNDAGCWVWTGAVVGNGYPCMKINRRTVLVHRLAIADQLSPGLQVDHLCRNIRCINPDHLEAVTQQENIRRQFAAMTPATHCQRGHEFTPENTGRQSTGRLCIACNKQQHRTRYLARRAAK